MWPGNDVILRSQSTAAAALNSRLEEDMEAIRQVVVIIIDNDAFSEEDDDYIP